MFDQMLSFFVANAYANTAGTPEQQGGGTFFVMLAVMVFFLYFAVWRPQSKQAKEKRQLLEGLAKGDEVVTAGGLLGKISKISDHYITLSIAANMDVAMQKSAVISVLPKGTLKTIE